MKKEWFKVKVNYEKIMANGISKKVTEEYLVDAISFTESEGKCIKKITPFSDGDFTISDIKKVNYSELFFSKADSDERWFKCKLFFITLDEKKGTEKKTLTQILVQAADLRDSVKNLDEGMKGTLADYVISSIAETNIMDVYPYESENE